jgi:hypothetical protein
LGGSTLKGGNASPPPAVRQNTNQAEPNLATAPLDQYNDYWEKKLDGKTF